MPQCKLVASIYLNFFNILTIVNNKVKTAIVIAGNTNLRARLSTVDLLIRIAYFVKKVNNVFDFKSS
jgi:hypothetical protein